MGPAAEADRRCERLVRSLQAEGRIPGVQACVARPDREPWLFELGLAAEDRPVSPTTRFRIGSITKTFTAVLVMQLRDAGRVALDDPLADHLDVPRHGGLTARRMLAHLSGLQREPHGDIWSTMRMPSREQLIAEVAEAEAVLPGGRRWHYSNLAYALLGELVAAVAGAPWEAVLSDRLLGPLGLAHTGIDSAGGATGYLVAPYADDVRAEPPVDTAGFAPMGQLWSTASDLGRWLTFLAAPDPAILQPATVDEMCEVQAATEPRTFADAWGLGLALVHRGGRSVHAGHLGAMPGFLAAAFFRREDRVAAAVLGNSGTAEAIADAPHDLIEASLAADPLPIEPWAPAAPPPAELADALGRWWSEGTEIVFCWRRGRLEAAAATAPPDAPPAVFAPDGADAYRTVSGREMGERLRLTRADGVVVEMHWAGYRLTRAQRTF